ncbi:LexA family transcriptional regulator [Ectopseudomonas mendocina]|uniref:LexA family transcriptional regulator n=1 Tax=Ectopseudomonas mendocina TaxID=300 RepID=UPI003F0C8825
MSYEESEPSKEDANSVPFPRAGIGTRIEAIADLFDSRKQAASTAGVAVSTLQRWLAEEGMPAFDSLARLALPKGVSLDWIATGHGSMFGEAQAAAPKNRVDEEDMYAYVPLYDARCSAGSGAWNERCRVLVNLSFTRYSLRKKGLQPAYLACLRVDGDSMVGLLDDGDTVMIDLSRNALEGEGVYVVMLDDHLYAKRLQRQFDGSVRIISHNKEYDPMTVPRERLAELQIIGRVVWAGGWMV